MLKSQQKGQRGKIRSPKILLHNLTMQLCKMKMHLCNLTMQLCKMKMHLCKLKMILL